VETWGRKETVREDEGEDEAESESEGILGGTEGDRGMRG
jgi:hypothetical protein